MPRPTVAADPVHVFEAGTCGVQTIERAMSCGFLLG
jgi:hypothetical protein